MKTFTFYSNSLLDYRKAIYLEDHRCLVISDVHIGKTAHFRKNGLALPNYSTDKEIQLIQQLVIDYTPQLLVFSGDLFHSQENKETRRFLEAMEKIPCQKLLIEGNHDSSHGLEGIENMPELVLGEITIVHDRKDLKTPNQLIISGHVHPGVKIGRSRHFKQTVAAFYYRKGNLILPAFGQYTGVVSLPIEKAEKVIGIGDKRLYELK